MAPRMATATALPEALEVVWAAGEGRDRFSWLWLRENCRAPHSYDPRSCQRLVDTFALPRDLRAKAVALGGGGEWLEVAWDRDGHPPSRYSARWLKAAVESFRRGEGGARRTWARADIEARVPCLGYAAVMANEAGLLRLLEAIERDGFALIAETPVSAAATRALAERIGYIRETVFGGFWELTADQSRGDSAYTPVAIGPHTDGTYSNDAPGLQMFHCLEFAGRGGESVLVDGFKAAQVLRAADPEAYEVLTRVEVVGEYVEPGIHLRASRPILRLDAGGELAQVSFNNYDRAARYLPPEEVTRFYDAARAFNATIQAPDLQFVRPLRPGEILLFDNWRCLHARHAYEGRRRLAGCYLNQEDFMSRLRVLRARRGADS